MTGHTSLWIGTTHTHHATTTTTAAARLPLVHCLLVQRLWLRLDSSNGRIISLGGSLLHHIARKSHIAHLIRSSSPHMRPRRANTRAIDNLCSLSLLHKLSLVSLMLHLLHPLILVETWVRPLWTPTTTTQNTHRRIAGGVLEDLAHRRLTTIREEVSTDAATTRHLWHNRLTHRANVLASVHLGQPLLRVEVKILRASLDMRLCCRHAGNKAEKGRKRPQDTEVGSNGRGAKLGVNERSSAQR